MNEQWKSGAFAVPSPRGRSLLSLSVLTMLACGRSPAPKPVAPPPNAPAVAEAAQNRGPTDRPIAAPAEASPTASAAALEPAVASPTGVPAAALPAMVTPDASIALLLGEPGAALPQAGKPTKVRVTPINALGQPIRELQPLMGAQVVVVALRADSPWTAIERSKAAVDPQTGAHELKVTFAAGGSHVLWFLFQPKGKPMAKVPAFVVVDGKPRPESDLEPARSWSGSDGTSVALATLPDEMQVCQQAGIASIWTRKGKPLALAGDTARVHYLAIEAGLGGLAIDEPIGLASVATPVGDPGAAALLTLRKPGRWRIAALAETAGTKSELRMAWFALDVGGELPPDGCPP